MCDMSFHQNITAFKEEILLVYVLSIYVTELLTSADYFFCFLAPLFLLTYMIALFEGHFLVKSPGYYYPLISVEKSYNYNFSFVETKLKDLN